MNDAATGLIKESLPPLEGDWRRDKNGRVTGVTCECGEPVFYRKTLHSRVVWPEEGTALCKRCRRKIRVPISFLEPDSPGRPHSG